MSTDKQIQANQQNAQKSTGPKNTDETRFNATWHGFRGSRVILSHEDPAEYRAMGNTFYNLFQPLGTYEHSLVEKMIDREWELRRATAMMAETHEEAEYRDVLFEELDRLSEYRDRFERSIIRLRKELTAVQKLRGKDFVAEGQKLAKLEDDFLRRQGKRLENMDEKAILFETEVFVGPHMPYLYSQGEIAIDNFVKQAAYNMRRGRGPNEQMGGLIRKMADNVLSHENAKKEDRPASDPHTGPPSVS